MRRENTEAISILLEDKRVDAMFSGGSALVEACSRGNLKLVQLLLQHNNNVIPERLRDLLLVPTVAASKTDVVRELLQHPEINPSAQNNMAISVAASKGNRDIVEMLLKDKRVDPTAQENQALQIAEEHGYQEIARLLQARIANP